MASHGRHREKTFWSSLTTKPTPWLLLFSIAVCSSETIHAGELNITLQESGNIEIAAQDAEVELVFATLGDLIGFTVTGSPGEACTTFSGKLIGEIHDLLGRIGPHCNFIISEAFGSNGKSVVSKIRFLNDTSQSSTELTISPEKYKYADELKEPEDLRHGPEEAHSKPAKDGFLGEYQRRLEKQERETVEKLWNWSSSEEPKTLCGNSRRDC